MLPQSRHVTTFHPLDEKRNLELIELNKVLQLRHMLIL